MQVAITEFKAKCTEYMRKLQQLNGSLEVTNRGKVVAIITSPQKMVNKNPVFGSLKNTVTYIAKDFDEPLGDEEWEASQDGLST